MSRLIRIEEVIHRTGRPRTQLYRAIKSGTFPAPIKEGRSSFWVEQEVADWIAAKIATAPRFKSPELPA